MSQIKSKNSFWKVVLHIVLVLCNHVKWTFSNGCHFETVKHFNSFFKEKQGILNPIGYTNMTRQNYSNHLWVFNIPLSEGNDLWFIWKVMIYGLSGRWWFMVYLSGLSLAWFNYSHTGVKVVNFSGWHLNEIDDNDNEYNQTSLSILTVVSSKGANLKTLEKNNA